MFRILLSVILAAGLLIGSVHARAATGMAPGESVTFSCPTELTGSFSRHEVTLTCESPSSTPSPATPSPSPAPSLTPSPSPSPTATPTPTPSPSPSATPSPTAAARTLIDGNGAEQALILRNQPYRTYTRTDWQDYAPVQNGAVVIYETAGATFSDCTFTDIRSQRNSNGTFKTDANDHIIYPGNRPGTVRIQGCTLDATKLNGAAVHVYPGSGTAADLIEISDTKILVGDMSYWGIAIFRAKNVVLRNVEIIGPLRTPTSAKKYGFRSLYGKAVELYAVGSVTMENVTWNGKLLTPADTSR